MSASRLKPATKRHNANISMAYGCDKDNNTYCYRRRPDGKTYLHRIVLGYGWENIPFDVTKLSCYEKGEDSMTSPTPTKEELLAIYQQCEGKIERVSKKIRKNWGKTKALLVEYGIIDTFGTPILQGKQEQTPPEPKGDQPDPAQETQEPANNSIPEKEITVKDVLMYELEQQDDFTVDDDKPIPYTVAPGYDLAPVKIQLIAAALAEYRSEQLPAFIALRLVKAIGDIELGVE